MSARGVEISRTRAWCAFVFAVACGPLGGCFVYHVAKVPVDVAVGTVEVAGGVVLGTAKVVGAVAGGTLSLAASLAQTGAVTFFDVASGTVTRVPWREGLTLAGASDAAKLKLASHAVDVVRAGKVVYSAANAAPAAVPIASGDVVQVVK